MTDITNPSFNREVSSYELGTVVRKGAASDGYIQPSSQPTLAAQETGISQGNFNEFAETHSSSSFDVTIDAGEAFVHGSWLARDTSTTVTLSSSTSNQSVYAGIDKSLANAVIIGKSGAFASLDPKIELYSFDTDSNGVTSVSDSRQIGHKIDVDTVNSTSVSTDSLQDGIAGSGNIVERVVGDKGDIIPLATYYIGDNVSLTATSYTRPYQNKEKEIHFSETQWDSQITNLTGDYYWSLTCRTRLDDGSEEITIRMKDSDIGNTSSTVTNSTDFNNNTEIDPEPIPDIGDTGGLFVEAKVTGSTGYINHGPAITIWREVA